MSFDQRSGKAKAQLFSSLSLRLPGLFSSSACLGGRQQALCIDYGSFASLSGGDSGPAWQLSISP